MITLNHPWNPLSIKDKLEVKLNLPDDEKVNDTEMGHNYEYYKGPIGLIPIYNTKFSLKATNQKVYNLVYLPFIRYFRYQFLQMEHPRLTEDYSSNIFLSSTN